jgi:beta-lactamase class A
MVVNRHSGLIALALCCGVFIGALSMNHFSAPRSVEREKDLMDPNESHGLTNPLLACGDINDLSVGAMEKLRATINGFINDATDRGGITHAAVYIRDLNNGPWIGIHEKEYFYPASLLKVPLLLAAYQKEEKHPGFLDQKVKYQKKAADTNYLFPPVQKLELGHEYSERELLRRAIIYSDNEAAALLGEAVGFGNLVGVFDDFGIQEPSAGEDYQMRVRTYASFFRVLYNASYINRIHSEEALQLLTESDFDNGIVAGTPAGVTIAHKFGEREGTLENGNMQLHDCGIVYAPQKPYLLCVMAQGKTTGEILDLMRRISQATYAVMLSS